MANPEHLATIEEGQRLRGWIANGYAQIEYLLGDAIVRGLVLPEYAGLGSGLPHGAPDRIKRVRRLLQVQGFFSEFGDEIEGILREFELHHETRNLLAHGFCSFHYTATGDCGLEFRKWHRAPDRHDARLTRTFRIADLLREKDDIQQLSQRALTLFARIHARLSLADI